MDKNIIEKGVNISGAELPPIKERVNKRGQIERYREIDGVEVIIGVEESIRDRFKYALYKAAMMNPDELTEEELSKMNTMERAAVHLCISAANGKSDAINQLFDRVLGKPKQVVENKNINLTIDDILAEAVPDEETGNNNKLMPDDSFVPIDNKQGDTIPIDSKENNTQENKPNGRKAEGRDTTEEFTSIFEDVF